jgi:hypothetical protein
MRKPGFVRSMRSGFNVLLAVLAVLRSSNVVAAAPVLVRCETTKGAVRMHVSGPHKPHARQAGCSAAISTCAIDSKRCAERSGAAYRLVDGNVGVGLGRCIRSGRRWVWSDSSTL